MKYLAIGLIFIYQKLLSPTIKQIVGVSSACRFTPSCSEYAKLSIKQNGMIKGGFLSAKRVLSCQPFFGIRT